MSLSDKKIKVIDATQTNVYASVIVGVVAVLCITGFGIFASINYGESYIGTTVTSILGIFAYFTKGPGFKNIAKSLKAPTLEEQLERHDTIIDLLIKSKRKISPDPSLATSNDHTQ